MKKLTREQADGLIAKIIERRVLINKGYPFLDTGEEIDNQTLNICGIKDVINLCVEDEGENE